MVGCREDRGGRTDRLLLLRA